MTTTVAPPFTVTPRVAGGPEADLTGFDLIHRALRSGARTLAGAATAVADGAPCPRARRRALVRFGRHVLQEIHVHHRKEDDVLWPVIVASTAGRVDLDPLTADHVALAGVLAEADAALVAVIRAGAGAMPAFATAMTTIADELDEHIADEEATVFPLIRDHVSAADFARCEEIFRKGTKPGHLYFMVPWIAAQCTESELAALLAGAPLPLQVMLRVAQGSWQRQLAALRG